MLLTLVLVFYQIFQIHLKKLCNLLQCLQIRLDFVACISINHAKTLITLFGQPNLRNTFVRQDLPLVYSVSFLDAILLCKYSELYLMIWKKI